MMLPEHVIERDNLLADLRSGVYSSSEAHWQLDNAAAEIHIKPKGLQGLLFKYRWSRA